MGHIGWRSIDMMEKNFLTEANGLCNNVILSILKDKNNNLWFGTRFGLSKLSAEMNAMIVKDKNFSSSTMFKNYGFDDGFLGIGCNGNAICESIDGSIWFGTSEIIELQYYIQQLILIKHQAHQTIFNSLI